ncbi:MAG TPA: hypothetical protein VF859_00245, partial [Burkholderiales bacterium]
MEQQAAPKHFTAQHPTLLLEVMQRPPREAAELLASVPASVACDVLARLNPAIVQDLLPELADGQKEAVLAAAAPEIARQWSR